MSAPAISGNSRHGLPWYLLAAFVVVSVLNVVGSAAGFVLLTTMTKPFIMPLLFVWALAVLPRPITKTGVWFLVGIGFAWLGDLLLMGEGDLFFVLGIAGFFGMQICYIVAYLLVKGPHLVKRFWWATIPFIAYWAFMNFIMDPGEMRIPILLYSIVLVGMSVVAFDLIPRLPSPLGVQVFIGSALFVVSDSFIALGAFAGLDWGNLTSFLIMATYTVAQFMIVTGMVRALGAMASTDPIPRQN